MTHSNETKKKNSWWRGGSKQARIEELEELTQQQADELDFLRQQTSPQNHMTEGKAEWEAQRKALEEQIQALQQQAEVKHHKLQTQHQSMQNALLQQEQEYTAKLNQQREANEQIRSQHAQTQQELQDLLGVQKKLRTKNKRSAQENKEKDEKISELVSALKHARNQHDQDEQLWSAQLQTLQDHPKTSTDQIPPVSAFDDFRWLWETSTYALYWSCGVAAVAAIDAALEQVGSDWMVRAYGPWDELEEQLLALQAYVNNSFPKHQFDWEHDAEKLIFRIKSNASTPPLSPLPPELSLFACLLRCFLSRHPNHRYQMIEYRLTEENETEAFVFEAISDTSPTK